MARRSPLTLITRSRVQQLENDVASLERLEKNVRRLIKDGTPLPFGYSSRLAHDLIRVNSCLAAIRPALRMFPFTRQFLDITAESNDKARGLDIHSRDPSARALAIVSLQSQLEVSVLYLHRLLEMIPVNVQLARESELFWERSALSRVKELPKKQRQWFYTWVTVGLYGILSLLATWAAFWFPILFKIIPSVFFPVVLESNNLVAYPGILPPNVGYSGLVVLIALAIAEAHALYGFVDILQMIDRIREGFRQQWEDYLDRVERGEERRMHLALHRWPDSYDFSV